MKETARHSKEPGKDPIDIASQSLVPSGSPRPVNGTHQAEDPSKSDEEHISLGTKNGADSDGGATETSSSAGTPEKVPRGRKLERKKKGGEII